MTNRLTTEHVHNSIDILLDRIRDMNSKIQAILISNTNTRKMTESHRVLYAETEARVRLIDTIAEEVTQLTNQSDYYNLVAQVNLDEAEDDFVVCMFLSMQKILGSIPGALSLVKTLAVKRLPLTYQKSL